MANKASERAGRTAISVYLFVALVPLGVFALFGLFTPLVVFMVFPI